MKAIIGAVFQLIGLVSGTVLLLTPFGMAPMASGPLIWFAFPCGCVAGHLLLISGSGPTEVRLVSMITGGALLLLAIAATVGQFLISGGIVAPQSDSFSLWYVASGGYVLGGMAWSLRNYGRGAAPKSEQA